MDPKLEENPESRAARGSTGKAIRMTNAYICAICGTAKSAGKRWLLVTESRWEEKILVLRWSEELALANPVHGLCCPAHVIALVAFWMATGGLNCAQPDAVSVATKPSAITFPSEQEIGELSVDRESIGRILRERPESLKAIMDELLDAMENDSLPQVSETSKETINQITSGPA